MSNSDSISVSLGLKLTLAVLGFTLISVVMMWGVMFYNNYRNEVRTIDDTILEIKEGNLPALTAAQWDLSAEQIKNNLKAVRAKPNILSVNLVVEEQLLPSFENKDVFRIVDFPLVHQTGGTIGVLRVVFSSRQIKRSALENNGSFFTVLVPIAVMAVGLILLFRIMITSPLIALARYTEKISMENIDDDFTRPGRRPHRGRDELDHLLDSIQKMKANIKSESNNRQMAEGRYENLFNSTNDALLILDSNGVIEEVNSPMCSLFKCRRSDTVGHPISDVIKNIGLRAESLMAAVERKEADTLSIRDWSPAGERRHLDITVYPLVAKDQDGFMGSVVRIDDVSDRVRMEELVIQSEKMVSVGGLAAGMAHEINNPLGGIIQTAVVMASRLKGGEEILANIKAAEEIGIKVEDIQKYMEKREIFRMLEMLEESGSRVADIVSNMLNFARKNDDFKSTCIISDLMDRTIELAASDYSLKKEYDFREITILRDYEENIPTVVCEQNRIQQVILNIIQNGAYAMHNAEIESPCFRIRIFHEKENGMVRIDIGDNGPGMDKSVSSRIFEPFYTTKPVGVGTGLGLSIAYFIITENHGGEITVDSRPGRGTVFRISLPLNHRRRLNNQGSSDNGAAV